MSSGRLTRGQGNGTDRGDETVRDTETLSRDDLVELVGALEAENRRLRNEYVQARRVTYRRTAFGLVGIALLSFGLAVVFPTVRTVLVALGGTGLFAGVLTYYLTPERFIAADVGERVYTSFAENSSRLVAQLGLCGRRVYVPGDESVPARLFVPQYDDYDLPGPEALEAPLVVTNEKAQRGLSLTPTGADLFNEFRESLPTALGETPEVLVAQLTDAVVETFELARDVRSDIDADGGRATFVLEGCAWGEVERVDHPIASLLAVGFAVGLDAPVELEVSEVRDGSEPMVTLRWDASER